MESLALLATIVILLRIAAVSGLIALAVIALHYFLG